MTNLIQSIMQSILTWPWGRLSLLCLFVVAACDQADPAVPALDLAQTPAGGTIVVSTPVTSADETATAVTERQLLLWAPPFFPGVADDEVTAAVAGVYAQFERNHPGVHVELQIKTESGDTSMLNYLRGAQRLAPTILPDLILVDSQQLWQIADLELIQPVSLSQLTNQDEFFPFTLAAVTYDSQLLGIPFATNLVHLIYLPDKIATPPTNWRELLALGEPYLFVAGKNEGINEALLVQYLGAGGAFAPEEAINNPETLRSLFAFAAEAKAAGIVPEDGLTQTSLEQLWELFTANQVSLTNTSAEIMLSALDTVTSKNIGYGQIPTSSGHPQTIAHVWAFAILTTDPTQAKLALDFIDLMLEPSVHSAWGQATKYIPTRTITFDSWRTSSEYYDFLREELDVAVALPNGRRYADFGKRLQQGYERVIRGEMTPDEAVVYVQAAP